MISREVLGAQKTAISVLEIIENEIFSDFAGFPPIWE